jgi:hypothetical protein
MVRRLLCSRRRPSCGALLASSVAKAMEDKCEADRVARSAGVLECCDSPRRARLW